MTENATPRIVAQPAAIVERILLAALGLPANTSDFRKGMSTVSFSYASSSILDVIKNNTKAQDENIIG